MRQITWIQTPLPPLHCHLSRFYLFISQNHGNVIAHILFHPTLIRRHMNTIYCPRCRHGSAPGSQDTLFILFSSVCLRSHRPQAAAVQQDGQKTHHRMLNGFINVLILIYSKSINFWLTITISSL